MDTLVPHEAKEGTAAVQSCTATAGLPGRRLSGTLCQRRSHRDSCAHTFSAEMSPIGPKSPLFSTWLPSTAGPNMPIGCKLGPGKRRLSGADASCTGFYPGDLARRDRCSPPRNPR
jgi:hypothetical protein